MNYLELRMFMNDFYDKLFDTIYLRQIFWKHVSKLLL